MRCVCCVFSRQNSSSKRANLHHQLRRRTLVVVPPVEAKPRRRWLLYCQFLLAILFSCHPAYYTHTTILWLWILSGTTQMSLYQKKHSPTYTYHGHQSSLICFLHQLQSMTSSLFNLCAWQSFSTISHQFFCGLPLGLAPSTSYSIHFFTQSLSSFRSTCPNDRNLFCCSTEIMSSNPSLSLNTLLGTYHVA